MRRLASLALVAFAVACAKGAPNAPVPSSSPCMPDAAEFDAQIWRPVFAATCIGCHNSSGLASKTRFVLSSTGGAAGAAKNFEVARQVAQLSEGGQPLLLVRSTGTNHDGGAVLQKSSASYAALATFIGRVRGDADACKAAENPACQSGDPGPRLLRRLSRAEYDASLRDLFGLGASYAASLVPDVLVDGFENNAASLTITPLLADQLRKVAEEVAQTVAAQPASACPGDGLACARTFLSNKAARIFRRPLTSAEVARWSLVYQVGSGNPEAGKPAHQSGMEAMIAGLLQSPSFLYRSELGVPDGSGRYLLTGYEIASELSYFLWGAPPDDELWRAASAGELRLSAQIAAQAKRLLASPRARGPLSRFTAQWLTIDQLAIAPKDPAVYPELTASLRAAMSEEASRLMAAKVSGGATLAELLTTPTTQANAELAKFYGLPAPTGADDTGFGDVTGRSGLLGTGAVLTAHARPNSSSPIARGKLVREKLLCQPLQPPPSGVVAQPPSLDPKLTTRQRYAAHATQASCASCHSLMDPIGFGFERYDGIGRYRASENGLAIDDSGDIKGSAGSDGAFNGVDGLAQSLASSAEVADCFALQWVRWAYGFTEGPQTACLVADVRAQFNTDGHVLSSLLVSLTRSSHFRYRLGEAGGASDGGTDGGTSDGDAGTPDAGATDGGAPDAGVQDAGGPPGDSPGVTAKVTKTNSWNTGYCATLEVTNVSAQPVTWRVTVTIDGTIYNHWNSDVVQVGGQATFNGASYNAVVAPGGTQQAGFCANL